MLIVSDLFWHCPEFGVHTIHRKEQGSLVPSNSPAGVGETWQLAELRQVLPVFGRDLVSFVKLAVRGLGGRTAYSVAEGDDEPTGSGGLVAVKRHNYVIIIN